MDEARSINGNLPPAESWRTSSSAAADGDGGGGPGDAYQRTHRRERESDKQKDKTPAKADWHEEEDPASAALLEALDRMAVVDGYRPVDQHHLARQQAQRAYATTRRIERSSLASEALRRRAASSIAQHAALEEKRVEELVDPDRRVTASFANEDYLPQER